ncbi:MAG: MGMT family protein [Nocardioides sp.]|nr:MGMT family protein [Nocardioides sp.]
MIGRGDHLARQAITLWPVPQAPEAAIDTVRRRLQDNRRGFDWRASHRILEALPAGRWTTYSALAEAVGTAPQPLANHVSTCSDCMNAYRVLTSEGCVADAFRWGDPEEVRDPREVLEHEGVVSSGAVADPEQKAEAEELLVLVGG